MNEQMNGPMTRHDWQQLAITSIKEPASAARTLLAMGFNPASLWTLLLLVAVGNSFLFTLSNMAFPTPSPLPGLFTSPLVYFAIVAGGLALTALSIVWIGRLMGGKGGLADVLVLVVWLQILRLVVQAVALVLMFVVPVLSALLVLAAGLIGIYMLVHFINQAHRLESLGKAVMVLIGSVLAIVVGLSVILSLVGAPFVGSPVNV